MIIAATPVLVQDVPLLRFSGYDWTVRAQGVSGPGPNLWNPQNVRVDKDGNLHLRITRDAGGKWHCAELTSLKKFGFGRYEFQTTSGVDTLDRNVVLGLFDYPTYGEDPDATNEIDIEFARWGNAAYPNGNFTVYPASGARGKGDSYTFEYNLPGSVSGRLATHRFTRTGGKVMFGTFAGEGKQGDACLARWTYAPSDRRMIPQKPLAVHINLWLFQGNPPTDGNEVEVVIKKFTFVPPP